MSAGFQKLFWGFFIVFIKIRIVGVDILPDPLGYFLIFQGIGLLMEDKEDRDYRRARVLAGSLMLLSIPTMFLWEQAESIQLATASGGWLLYGTAVSLLKLVLVFHIFRMIIDITRNYGQNELESKVKATFNTYMMVLIPVTVVQSFLMNFSGGWLIWVGIMIIAAAVIMEIVFLVLLNSLKKHSWEKAAV